MGDQKFREVGGPAWWPFSLCLAEIEIFGELIRELCEYGTILIGGLHVHVSQYDLLRTSPRHRET